MSSYRKLIYHFVFRTKNGAMALNQENAPRLYSYIAGIIKKKDSHLYQVNGIENHIHLVTDIHPAVAVSDFVRTIKGASSLWIKESGLFPSFKGWAVGYGCFTCSYLGLETLIAYVKNQQIHHVKRCFDDEYRSLITESGLDIDESYFL